MTSFELVSESAAGSVVLPDRPMLRDPDLERRLRHDGYVVVDALGPDEVARLAALVEGLYGEARSGFHSSLMSGDHAYRAAVFEQVPPAFEAIASALFHDYEPFAASLTLKWPGDGSELEAHQDYTMVDEHRFRSLNIWCPLTDTSEDNGALSVLPHSHLVLDHLRCGPANPTWVHMEATHVRHEEMELVPLRAGQAVVFDHALLHGSVANRSGHPRPAVTVAYRPVEAPLVHLHVPDLGSDVVDVHEVGPEFFQHLEIGSPPAGAPSGRTTYRGTPRRKQEILDACASLDHEERRW